MMRDHADVRIGLVGCGRLAARGYVPALRRAAGVRLVAVADVDRARAEALTPELPAYDSAETLVAEGGLDGVIIATPTRSHARDAAVMAAAGLPALVEKPPGLDVREASRLAALRPAPHIGFNRRFDPDLAQLREMLANGPDVDIVLMMQYRRRAWGAYDMEDDALLDLGPHLVDLASWLTRSEIARVRARTLTPQRAVIEMELARSRAIIHCATDRVYAERVELRDGRQHRLVHYRRGGLARAVLDRLLPRTESPLIGTMTRQVEAFARTIRGAHGGPLATSREGLAVMAVLDAARRSAAAGSRWHTVDTFEAHR